jgi:hypothetical protein
MSELVCRGASEVEFRPDQLDFTISLGAVELCPLVKSLVIIRSRIGSLPFPNFVGKSKKFVVAEPEGGDAIATYCEKCLMNKGSGWQQLSLVGSR